MSDKFILTKDGMYVGKGYLNHEFFKMNVMTVVPLVAMNKNNTSSNYLFEFSIMWHGRLNMWIMIYCVN